MVKKVKFSNAEIFNKIDYFRKEKGWSLYELANQANISTATLYEWSSNRKHPSLANIEKLCIALGISLSQFFAETEIDNLNSFQVNLIEICKDMDTEQQEALLKVAKIIAKGKN